MATAEGTPQIIRSRRNIERKGNSDLNAYELDDQTKPPFPTRIEEPSVPHDSTARLTLVPPSEYFGYFSTSALIFNKMFGTGIFVTPAIVLAVTNSKSTSIILWLIGGFITWAGLAVYLEYGIRFPLNGGELHYIDHVWTRPKMLLTYVYSLMFVVISGPQGNALVFGKAVIMAATPEGAKIDTRLQKFFAILVIGFICQLQAFSRLNFVRFNNFFAVYKITLFTFLTIAGWCVLAGHRASEAATIGSTYGVENLRVDFGETLFHPYNLALGVLSIMRAFVGYENANFVLEEVRRKPGDEMRVYKRAAKSTVLIVSFFYLMVNVAFFAACSTDELLSGTDTLSIFFAKVFGPSPKARQAAGTIQAISAFGHIMSYIYANVKVRQEIARLGIVPYPEYWARTNSRGAPGPALLMTFIFATVMVIASPLNDANGLLVVSTLFAYERTWISVFLGSALLAAPWLQSFQVDDRPWKPKGSRGGFKLIAPMVAFWVIVNILVLVFCWWPADVAKSLHIKGPITPSITGPIIGTAILAAGVLYWLWDLHFLRWFGYRWQVNETQPEGGQVNVIVTRIFDRQADDIYYLIKNIMQWWKSASQRMQERWEKLAQHL